MVFILKEFLGLENLLFEGEKGAKGRKMEFIGQCVTFLIILKDKKKFCALTRSFWHSARFWDFFGLCLAKKIPKTLPQEIFLSFLMILTCISP